MRATRPTATTNQTLLVKLTPGVPTEARALCRPASRRAVVGAHTNPRRAARRDLLVIRDARKPDQVAIGRRRFDLGTDAGRRALVDRLGLGGHARQTVLAVLAHAPADSRDELAQLARVLHWSAQGKVDLRRLVLSGHYAGQGIRGNQAAAGDRRPHNGSLSLATLGQLVAAFPRAARKIEHLMIAACFLAGPAPTRPGTAAGRGVLASYRGIFPGLKSVTAYRGKAPASGGGAEHDLRRWARATRRGDAPSRAAVFGACKPEARATSLAHKRSGGVVHTQRSAETCPPPRH